MECAFVRARKQKGPLSTIWFDEQCRLKRKLFIAAVKRGEPKHACQFLRTESRRCNQGPPSPCHVTEEADITPVRTTAWNQHLQSHFRVQPTVVPQEGGHGCSTKNARFTCLPGRDVAVPLGRNHAPLEVLLRQGAESGWVPQPDCLETPITTVLEGMVGSHIKKLNA
eukprot:1142128-Pelagomonas_calceolata.AAC.1